MRRFEPNLQSPNLSAQPLPRNADVADQFDLLADLLELEGADSFRVIAYRRAATRMRETSGSIAQLALDGRAKELQGIGKTIEEKIVQIVQEGKIEALARTHHVIEAQPRFLALAITEPADPRREALERNALSREREPTF